MHWDGFEKFAGFPKNNNIFVDIYDVRPPDFSKLLEIIFQFFGSFERQEVMG